MAAPTRPLAVGAGFSASESVAKETNANAGISRTSASARKHPPPRSTG
ncbi:hypothetical protein [Amycolatopsis keratiniphila]|nr:hypothetical protein [Amycolatopsis keratiniphila]